MAKPNRIPGDEDGELIRPSEPPLSSNEDEERREPYPGWETLHGRPHDPRFEAMLDPNKDDRYSTHLQGSAVLPEKPGATVWIWFAFLGLVLGALFGLLMFWHFQTPSQRNPRQAQVQVQSHMAQAQVQQGPIHNVNTVIADSLLPLRTRHRLHRR